MENKIFKIIFVSIVILFTLPIRAYAEGELAGTVNIMDDGTPQYGETVSVDILNITNNTGDLSYQWLRDGVVIPGETSSSHAIVKEDIGTDISVNVTSSVETGTISSNAISIAKADRQAPDAPTLYSGDHYNVTLTVVEGCEYKMAEGSFGASNTFANLNSHTTYTFYQRYAETDTHKASPASEGLTVTTDYIVLTNTNYNINKLKSGDGVLINGSVTLKGSQNVTIHCNSGAKLTLESVYINAAGMSGECGIKFAGSDSQLILKGSNKIYSGSGRAGIETQGSLTISGTGTLYAKGGTSGAGIGGSNSQSAGTISITGGEIIALAGSNAAGIGGGNGGAGGSVKISGGLVYVSGSSNDIGSGNGGGQGTLSISGACAVFMKNNLCPTPSTSTHSLYSSETVSGGTAYGYAMPNLWADGDVAYAYIRYYTVAFNTNGAGDIDIQSVGASAKITSPTDPTKAGQVFGGWYSDSGFTKPFDTTSDKVHGDMTLYAKWNIKVSITVNKGGSTEPETDTEVQLGKDLLITCKPNEHYYVSEIKSTAGHSIVDNQDKTYTIKNITKTDTIEITYESEMLLGTVMIEHDGFPEYGEKISVYTDKITNNPDDGKLKYQWKRDGKDINGATKQTYTIQAKDIGKKIGVDVSSTKKEGTLNYELTKKTQKAMKSAPKAPILLEKTRDSITLQILEGCEYKIQGENWQDSNIFTDLEPETAYVFYQRYAESGTHKSSNSSFSVKLITDGFNITEVNIALESVEMHKGNMEEISSVMQYSIYPLDPQNEDLTWESSNEKVAIINESTGTITALAEGKTIITVTAVDTTNGIISDTCVLEVYDPTPADINAYLGTLSGVLLDSQGIPLKGYTITLYSDPITIQTNDFGEYSIENIPYTHHTLIVENKDGEEAGRFIIKWSLGEESKANVDNANNVINITYTENTSSVSLPIQMDTSSNEVKIKNVDDITFLDKEGKEMMPKRIYVLILMGIIVACIIGVGYILYIGKIQRQNEYDGDEFLEDGYDDEFYEQQMLSENVEVYPEQSEEN